LVFLAWLERLGRLPVGDDVVVDLLANGDLDQLHVAVAPAPGRLDPGRGTLVVTRIEVLEAGKGAVALNEAEALEVLVDEGARLQRLGVGQRAPQALSVPVHHGETLAVVDGRAIVAADARLGRAVEVHAGERRDADVRQGAARIEDGVDLHLGRAARPDDKAVGSGDALAV